MPDEDCLRRPLFDSGGRDCCVSESPGFFVFSKFKVDFGHCIANGDFAYLGISVLADQHTGAVIKVKGFLFVICLYWLEVIVSFSCTSLFFLIALLCHKMGKKEGITGINGLEIFEPVV